MATKTENPFYHQYVFTKEDLNRAKIKWWEYPFLWLKSTKVQISEGFAVFYKRGSDGRVYMMKVEKLH